MKNVLNKFKQQIKSKINLQNIVEEFLQIRDKINKIKQKINILEADTIAKLPPNK